jgi:hypothetical protein
MWWHTRKNQFSSFGQTDEPICIGAGGGGGGVSSFDYWQASCAHQPAGFVLLVQACVLQSCDANWLPTTFSCFPFTSPPVRHQCHHISNAVYHGAPRGSIVCLFEWLHLTLITQDKNDGFRLSTQDCPTTALWVLQTEGCPTQHVATWR